MPDTGGEGRNSSRPSLVLKPMSCTASREMAYMPWKPCGRGLEMFLSVPAALPIWGSTVPSLHWITRSCTSWLVARLLSPVMKVQRGHCFK